MSGGQNNLYNSHIKKSAVDLSNSTIEAGLFIAPCGMNCGICIGHLRKKNKCSGCNSKNENRPQHCIKCSIKYCEYLKDLESNFCYDCPKYPCARLKQLDKRYRTKYRMSMIENLIKIKSLGLEEFLNQENQKWTCTNCHARLSVHRESCLECGVRIVR